MKKVLSIILTLVLLLSIAPFGSVVANAAVTTKTVSEGDVVQGQFTVNSTAAYYKITATDNMYYKFTFTNQSVELKTGISIADDLLNLFFGKFSVEITDQYDAVLSNLTVKCGYSGNVSLKLSKGQTYYIKITSNADGFYKMKVDAFSDIAGNTWNTAAKTESVGQLISSIDANGDTDWFYFETDETDSFYKFALENISGSSTMRLYLYEYVEGAGQVPLRETFSISASSSYTTNKLLKLKPDTKYYLSISLNSGVGGYQLDIVQTVDAVADTQDKAFNVQTDTKITTALDAENDLDFFKFTTKDYDAYYYFNIDNLGVSNDLRMAVYDKDGNELDSKSVYTGSDLTLDTKLEPNTEYYFKIYAAYSGFGNYSFTITDIPDRFANEQSNAGEIKLNTTVSESISGEYDVDFYKFTTESYDAYYYFNIENLGITNDLRMTVYDKDGNELDNQSVYTGSDLTLDTKLEPNTEYYFKIYASYTGKGNYTITVLPKADPYPNTFEEAKKIDLNKEITESITGKEDVDFFKFTTTDIPAFYHINMQNLGISNDARLALYDANGNEIETKSVYSGYDLEFNKKLEPNTEYYFKLYAAYSGVGNYKVTVTYTEDKAGDVKQEAEEIFLNQPITEHLSSDKDIDWYKLSLPYDCNVRMVAVNESGNSKKFILYSAIDKQLVSLNPYSSSNKSIILDAGDYYLKVYDANGYYTLSVGDCGSAHKETEKYLKATTESDGIKTVYCKSCNTQIKKEVIARIEKVSLSFTKADYNGKEQKPTVSVYDSNNNLIPSNNYSVIYPENCVDTGVCTLMVKFKDCYDGEISLDYQITGGQLKTENGTAYYYLDGEKQNITDLVKINGVWYYISNGVWDTSIDTLHKINGKWFLIKGGIWKAITGLEEYKGKTFYVVGGKWNADVTDLKNVDGKWYYIQYGKWNNTIDTLHKINGKWFLIKKGMWNKTTGLVDYQGKTFLVKGGKWDSSVNTLYKKGTKLYAIKSGKVYTGKTVISYNGKKYYCNKGYAQTSYSGKVKIGSKTYTVKKGIVK